jgi:autophagy-related protein 9
MDGVRGQLGLVFQQVYNYYYQRGLVPILGNGVVQLVTLFFTLCLSIFLFAYVDWKGLSSCIDESLPFRFCASLSVKKPFSQECVERHCYSVLYLVLVYGLFATWAFYRIRPRVPEAKWVFEDRLGISARKLEGGAVGWDRDVVTKLLELQQSGQYRIAIHGQCRTHWWWRSV